MDILTILNCLLIASAAFNLAMRYKVDLQMMQQNSYRNNRYLLWWKTNSDYASISRITDVGVLLLLFTPFPSTVTMPIASLIFIFKGIAILKKKHKKPLVFTNRVWRLYITMLVFSIIFIFGAILGAYPFWGMATGISLTVMSAISWLILIACNQAMKPIENAINQMYYNDAKRLLESMPDMKIIGITGSYGKTSTKHYLHRILSEQFDVLMTPGSFNTPMGVIRTVREMMKPYNDVFIVEMGAKQLGDIKEICDLVHPEIGIVTAVGEQHLESFKSIENVQRTKFELVDALPENGLAVVNNDFEYIKNREISNVKALRYGIRNTGNAIFTATEIEYDEYGTHFTVCGEGKELRLDTKLVGECNISNLIGAVIVAMKLGVSDEKIKYAVSKIEQVEHRLNMKRTPGGVTIIDDAFNSNPDGSKMALDVLSRMKKGKRIVITPGMIELGDKQHYHNANFGEHIAKCCDIAIIVGQYNRNAILEGISRVKSFPQESVIVVDTFNEAQAKLSTIISAGDTVLYENDLPDTFK